MPYPRFPVPRHQYQWTPYSQFDPWSFFLELDPWFNPNPTVGPPPVAGPLGTAPPLSESPATWPNGNQTMQPPSVQNVVAEGLAPAGNLGLPPPAPSPPPAAQPMPAVNYDRYGRATINLSKQDVENLARMAWSEVGHFSPYGMDEMSGAMGGVVDAALNRVAQGAITGEGFPDNPTDVLNQNWAFTGVTKRGGIHNTPTAQELQDPAILASLQRAQDIVEQHIENRISGAPSTVGRTTYFGNPDVVHGPGSEASAATKAAYLEMQKDPVQTWGNVARGDYHIHGMYPGTKPAPLGFGISYDELVSPTSMEVGSLAWSPEARPAPRTPDGLPVLNAAPTPIGPNADPARIAELQSNLIAIGFDPGPVDGVYGEATAMAVAQAQEALGRTATGIADLATLSDLSEQLNPSMMAAGPAPGMPDPNFPMSEATPGPAAPDPMMAYAGMPLAPPPSSMPPSPIDAMAAPGSLDALMPDDAAMGLGPIEMGAPLEAPGSMSAGMPPQPFGSVGAPEAMTPSLGAPLSLAALGGPPAFSPALEAPEALQGYELNSPQITGTVTGPPAPPIATAAPFGAPPGLTGEAAANLSVPGAMGSLPSPMYEQPTDLGPLATAPQPLSPVGTSSPFAPQVPAPAMSQPPVNAPPQSLAALQPSFAAPMAAPSPMGGVPAPDPLAGISGPLSLSGLGAPTATPPTIENVPMDDAYVGMEVTFDPVRDYNPLGSIQAPAPMPAPSIGKPPAAIAAPAPAPLAPSISTHAPLSPATSAPAPAMPSSAPPTIGSPSTSPTSIPTVKAPAPTPQTPTPMGGPMDVFSPSPMSPPSPAPQHRGLTAPLGMPDAKRAGLGALLGSLAAPGIGTILGGLAGVLGPRAIGSVQNLTQVGPNLYRGPDGRFVGSSSFGGNSGANGGGYGGSGSGFGGFGGTPGSGHYSGPNPGPNDPDYGYHT